MKPTNWPFDSLKGYLKTNETLRVSYITGDIARVLAL
jgi:hypothetical protein